MFEPSLHDAVRAVYSNAGIIYGNDVNSLIVHDANGQNVQIVPETVTAQLTILQANYTAQQATAEQHKQNAISKLTALGLTADEISALGV